VKVKVGVLVGGIGVKVGVGATGVGVLVGGGGIGVQVKVGVGITGVQTQGVTSRFTVEEIAANRLEQVITEVLARVEPTKLAVFSTLAT
jgi:hypothetical protein